MGPGEFFPINLDLADILGDTDFDFDNFLFHVLDPIIPERWMLNSQESKGLMPRDIMSSEPRQWMLFGQLVMAAMT